MKPNKTLISAAIFLLCGLASAGALAQGLSVNVGGVSVGTGSSGNSTSSATSGLTNALNSATGSASSEQQQALDAVKSQRAVGLDKIFAAARQYTDGDIIDARLITARGFLLYDLKVLDTKGDVGDLYFYARSGKIVETK